MSTLKGNEVIKLKMVEETISDKIARLQKEASDLGKTHTAEMHMHLCELITICNTIAYGGQAYAPGIREICRQIADDLESKSQNISSLMARL